MHDQSLLLHRDICPICASQDLSPVYRRGYSDAKIKDYITVAYQGNAEHEFLVGHDFEIVECARCTLMFQTNVLGDEGTRRLYDVWIDPQIAKKWHDEEVPDDRLKTALLRFARAHLRRGHVKMLDYGAGFGHLCQVAHRFGFEVNALEISHERRAYLEQLGISVTNGDCEHCYDFINLDQVLEHVNEPVQTLKHIRKLLADDGLLFVSVPNCRTLKNRLARVDSLPIHQYRTAMLDCGALQHINCFTHKALVQACTVAGFEVVFRPLLFLGSCTHDANPMFLLKSIIRPFYYNTLGTSLFLRKGAKLQD